MTCDKSTNWQYKRAHKDALMTVITISSTALDFFSLWLVEMYEQGDLLAERK